ncbi:chemotaxis protein CheD [Pseudoduganella flava]|nr:chemotaxis protein CheD [Pseudoduganella flava]TWI46613.1 chemotaxis protein CheD [Pseudoduganella flava]
MPNSLVLTPPAGTAPNLAAADVTHVWAGALAVGSGNMVLTALLGSCVGIGILWRRKKRCALAHCLLAEAPPDDTGLDLRYVSNALPALLRGLGAREEDYAELEVIAAGGASLFERVQFPLRVGERNIAALERAVQALGLRVVHQFLGGSHGSRITLHCATQTYDTRRIGPDAAR